MRHRSRGIFQIEAAEADPGDRGRDLAGDRLRRANIERAVIDLLLELGAGHARPATLRPQPIMQLLIMRPHLIARLVIGFGDMARRMHAQRAGGIADLRHGPVIKIDQRAEAHRIAPDDRQHHLHIMRHGAHHRLRASLDTDPRVPA